MCGRFANHLNDMRDWSDLLADWPADAVRGFNVAPTQRIPVFTADGGQAMRWGLIPGWSKSPSPRYATFNARIETAHSKASYHDAWQQARRCLVPTLGYYEWRKEGPLKQPYFIRPADRSPLVLAGLWQPAHDENPASCTILTCHASAQLSHLHPRMPVAVRHEKLAEWFEASAAELATLIDRWPEIPMNNHPVSTRVNNVSEQGEQLIEPVGNCQLPFD